MQYNKLFQGIVYNTGNVQSHFNHFNICTVQQITDYNGEKILEEVHLIKDRIDRSYNEDVFYMLIGSPKTKIKPSVVIGEFDNLSDAIYLAEMLTGNKVQETYAI